MPSENRSHLSSAAWVSLILLASTLGLVATAASATEAPAVSPASRLSTAPSFSEYWDLSARFDSGHRLFARFSISNEGPGDETAYAIGQMVFPDGRVSAFQNGRRRGRWSLSEDRLRIEIGSSVLDLHGPDWHVEVDKNRAGQKVYLTAPATPERARAWTAAPEGIHLDLLQSGAPIQGTIWIRGLLDEPLAVAGVASATHTSMNVIETELTHKRVELHAGDGSLAVYLIDVMSPSGSSKRWLVVEKEGAVVVETDEFEVEYTGLSPHSVASYPAPARILVRGPRVSGSISLGALLVRHDPLSIAPQPFRWLLSFKMEPDHAWFDAASSLVVDGEHLEASGVVSVFYTNESGE